MGCRRADALPVARHHRAIDRARVCIAGRCFWLGGWCSPEAWLRYDELIAGYGASGRKSVEAATPPPPPTSTAMPATVTVGELALAYLQRPTEARGKDSSTYAASVVATRALRPVRALPAYGMPVLRSYEGCRGRSIHGAALKPRNTPSS